MGGEVKADRVVREELERLGWIEGEVRRRPKGDAGEVMIALRVRRETTMTLASIANRLGMGTWTYVSTLLRAAPKPPNGALRHSRRCQ